MASEPRALLAAAMTGVGGALITTGGLVLWLIGTVLAHVFHFSSAVFVVGVLVGLLAMACGGAIALVPRARRLLGAVALACAVISIPFAFGGFLLGFALTAAGGALAIVQPRFPVAGAGSPPWGRPPPWT